MQRPVSAAATAAMCEHIVSAGTPIFVDAYGLHRDPALYPDPGRFAPERFLDRSPEPYSWLPFGGGAHRCPGSGLAEMEIATILTAVLRRVEFTPASRSPAIPVRRAVTLFPSRGAQIRVTRRRARL